MSAQAGDVVAFRFRDPIFGTVLDGQGVVRAVEDGTVTVTPLSSSSLRVDPADVTVLFESVEVPPAKPPTPPADQG